MFYVIAFCNIWKNDDRPIKLWIASISDKIMIWLL